MSKEFRELFQKEIEQRTKPEMRLYCQRPGDTNPDGTPDYFTEQAHKDECDVNKIIAKYDKQGLITHINKFEAQFGDATRIDFKQAMDLITNSTTEFNQLPSEIRKRFNNSPGDLLGFMEDPENRKEAIELGLIRADTLEDLDGLGEHVKDGKRMDRSDNSVAGNESGNAKPDNTQTSAESTTTDNKN